MADAARTLPKFASTLKRRFGRSGRLLAAHAFTVVVGCICIPLHAAVMLAVPAVMGQPHRRLSDTIFLPGLGRGATPIWEGARLDPSH